MIQLLLVGVVKRKLHKNITSKSYANRQLELVNILSH